MKKGHASENYERLRNSETPTSEKPFPLLYIIILQADKTETMFQKL
jgi:hypothetical protein